MGDKQKPSCRADKEEGRMQLKEAKKELTNLARDKWITKTEKKEE